MGKLYKKVKAIGERMTRSKKVKAIGERMTRSKKVFLISMALFLAVGAFTALAGSHDSGKITFVSDRDGNREIYIMNADGSDQRNVTCHAAWDSDPAWSPDGKKIAFVSDRDTKSLVGDLTWTIYVIDIEGGHEMQVTSTAADNRKPMWSPDGKKIAFSSNRESNYRIYLIDPDGSNQMNLTDNLSSIDPVWSPDGMKVAFIQCDGWILDSSANMEICIANVDGSDQMNLTNTAAWDGYPVWSPDGSKIAFITNRDGNEEIYVMNADGSNQVNLTNNPGIDIFPCWSPDGTRIAFVSDRDGNEEIYVMNADGSNQVNLTINSASDFSPAWSPDGTKIAFSSERDGNAEIYVMNEDGNDARRLTRNDALDLCPVWCPFLPQKELTLVEEFSPGELLAVLITTLAVVLAILLYTRIALKKKSIYSFHILPLHCICTHQSPVGASMNTVSKPNFSFIFSIKALTPRVSVL